MHWTFTDLVRLAHVPLGSEEFRSRCRRTLDRDGVLVLPDFLSPAAIESIQRDGEEYRHLAYYTVTKRNIFLKPTDTGFAPRNFAPSESARMTFYGRLG